MVRRDDRKEGSLTTIEAAALALALERKVGFDFDRNTRIGASEIGKCGRQIVSRKLGIKPDADVPPTSGFAVRGDIMEDNWIAPLLRAWVKANGGELKYSGQADQTSLKGGKTPLSSTPDGLAVGVKRDILAPWGVKDIGKSRELVPEMKSIDPRVGSEKLPKAEHVVQVIQQIGMLRAAKLSKAEWGALFYVDASDYFKVHVFPVKWDEKKFKSLVQRGSKLLACTDPNQWAPEGKINGGRDCGTCEYAKSCLGFIPWMPGDDPRQLKPKQIADVEKASEKVHVAQQKIEAAQQEERLAKAGLMGVLSQHRRNFVMGTRFVASAKPTASQMRDDVSAMKAWIKKKGGNPEGFKKPTKPGESIKVELRS